MGYPELLRVLEDEAAREAMRDLARAGVVAGESGAAGLAGLTELMAPEHTSARAKRLTQPLFMHDARGGRHPLHVAGPDHAAIAF